MCLPVPLLFCQNMKLQDKDKNMYEYKEKYTLDFTDVKGYYDLHAIIKTELDFPDYYGANWDAFWDCITDMIASPDDLNIEVIGLDKIYSKYKEDVDILIDILKRLKHVYGNKYCDRIKIVIHHGNNKVELT